MNRQAEQLFELMRQDMEHCRSKELDRLCELECCFHIAESYWAKLRQDLTGYVFENMADEIKFFRYIKPKFTSEVEYYSLLYHAELFRKDVLDAVSLQKFWAREQQRLQRFITENEEFCGYYKKGDSSLDEIYFLRKNSDLSNFPRARVYDLDEKATTSHDSLVSTLLALERYMDFIKEELNVLHGDQ